MLTVYFTKNVLRRKNMILDNDSFFNINCYKLKEETDNLKHVINTIDKSEYIGNFKVRSRIDRDICISITEISTGSKTILNTYYFPENIFTTQCCGLNALEFIFSLDRGSVYVSKTAKLPAFNNTIKVVTGRREEYASNLFELRQILTKKNNEV